MMAQKKKMLAKWKGETDPLYLTHNKVYEVLSIECGFYRVVDETGEDYLYDGESFEVVQEGDVSVITDEDIENAS